MSSNGKQNQKVLLFKPEKVATPALFYYYVSSYTDNFICCVFSDISVYLLTHGLYVRGAQPGFLLWDKFHKQ